MTDDISNLVGELRQRGDRMSHRAADAIEDLRYTLNNVTKMYDRACEDIQIYSEQIRDLTNKVTTES